MMHGGKDENRIKKAPDCGHTVGGGSDRIIIVANDDNVFRQEWYPGTSSKDYGVTLVELD